VTDAEIVALPTQANDAEICLLGAVMAGYSDIAELVDVVNAEDFWSQERAETWRAIVRLHHDGTRPDVVAVRTALAAAKVRHDPIRLFEWTQVVPLVAQAPFYAEQVATAAGMRRIQEAGTKLQQLGASPGDLTERQEQARQTVDEACAGRVASRARMLADLIDDTLDVAENGTADTLSTPWPDLDRLISGISPGRLIVIGARPGVGKSIAGTNLALHVATHHGHAALIASLEMPEREVMQRLLAAYATVGLSGLQNGNVPDSEWRQVSSKYAALAAMPIAVDDHPGLTVNGIRSAARTMQRSHDDLALIVVDYLQLVRPSERRGNRAEEVSEISRGLKLLARETGACVVAMAQLNRESVKRDGKPSLTDLRESGSIEADADQVILMHQPDDDIPEVHVLVDKNRHGPRGHATLQIAGAYAQLRSVAYDPTRGLT
jgi:replicative DNA helicase